MDTSPYHEGMRQLQDMRETRALADTLSARIIRTEFTEEDRAFIQRCRMFFIATADDQGFPDCSYKGGAPGFVRVIDEHTLAFPDYDGNGMYRTLGNALVNPHIGLLFIDFENPRRLRINGTAMLSFDDPLIAEFPGAVLMVRVTATRIFPNCPRYIHKVAFVEASKYTPRENHVPPVPEWKKSENFRAVLPPRDRPTE